MTGRAGALGALAGKYQRFDGMRLSIRYKLITFLFRPILCMLRHGIVVRQKMPAGNPRRGGQDK